MSIEAIGAISAPLTMPALAAPAAQPGAGVFDAMVDAVNGLNQQMRTNDQAVQALALGDTGELHQVMMNLEKSRLTFELALQVRNKALEAYQELMRMQV
jgi:flagellar hook-basal body complex protein FliE